MKPDMNNFTLAMPSVKDPSPTRETTFTRLRRIRRAAGLAFLFTVLATAGAYAQSFHLGVEAGTNVAKLGGQSFNNKYQAGFMAGVYGELNLNSMWGVQPELIFSQTVATTNDNFNQLFPGVGVSDQKFQLNYVELPLLLAFRPVPELTILLGPQFGYLANQTKGLLANDKDAFTKYDMSILFGGQLNLGKVKIGARYVGQLNDVNNIGGETWKNHGFQFYLGYRLK
jgi:hypothetical protein